MWPHIIINATLLLCDAPFCDPPESSSSILTAHASYKGGGLGAPRQAGRRCTPGVTALRGAAAGPLGFPRVRGVLGPWIGARGAAQRPGGAARLRVHPSLISPVTARRPVADWLSESAEGWRTKGW